MLQPFVIKGSIYHFGDRSGRGDLRPLGVVFCLSKVYQLTGSSRADTGQSVPMKSA